jgi:predicted CXXCH cytochrome family protein
MREDEPMRGRRLQQHSALLAGLAGLGLMLLLSACTEEKTVFVELPQYEDPPVAAVGFLGYDDRSAKLTVCGNCHIGEQVQWKNTAHAGAWKTLQDSGHAQAFCENCHTVSELGSATTGDVAWSSTDDARYHDVQCESCHSSGNAHVRNPGASQPVASIKVLGDPAKQDAIDGCAECHNGTHHPFAEEWEQSPHAEPLATVLTRATNDPAHYGSCLACHTAQGALTAWGVNAPYLEKDAAVLDHEGIVCAVCHDPHDGSNAGQLRFPIDVADENLNLCMKCHNRNEVPQASSSRGPHAPEGPLLLGEAGWVPPGFPYAPGDIVPSHGAAGNPGLCTTCHVSRFEVTDSETGEFAFQATGHLFLAIPCIDENGLPYNPAEGEECDISERSFNACATSGCHGGNPETARLTFSLRSTQLQERADDLQLMLDQVPPTEFDTSNGITVAEGAKFNMDMARLPGTVAHNGLLMSALLEASIDAVSDTYSISKISRNSR